MIVVDQVAKRFGKVTALDGVSLRIADGERVALVGSNGSGKTTLLRAMVGLLHVSGSVTIDGVDVARAPERALRALAYVPQSTPPLEAPVFELVHALGTLRGMAERDVASEADGLGLSLAAIARVRLRDLSGGMKQKLALALALASAAPILVCDEPTASLDVAARAALFARLSERPADASLVVCSHRLDEVSALVDRVIELRDGKVVRDEAVQRESAPSSAARVMQLRRSS